MASASARLCCHTKELPKIKVSFILMLQYSVTQSARAAIISFSACCHERMKNYLGVRSFLHIMSAQNSFTKTIQNLHQWMRTRKCEPNHMPRGQRAENVWCILSMTNLPLLVHKKKKCTLISIGAFLFYHLIFLRIIFNFSVLFVSLL